ncbi:glucose-1-phosphate adenylyltransferase [uncultured Paraglaciecola sp.]|uniref:glucose-1-phosphate adenylyltransferase n=1 Tax=uncultured Paraglaciecola sp. TaxID=1765024 RepID=UPI0025947C8E|nr:glucose-1-phosphate adenylyltransferase [uncultured Paraglaciecola sp.]
MEAITDVQKVVENTMVLVLAGGQGSRLKQLTQMRAKPVLEFGSHCRIIDFPLSNCVNSGLNRIAVLTQYKSQCLIRHLMQQWGALNDNFGGRLDILPASQQHSENWYQGTADACYQNLSYIKEMAPKYVMILSGDHVYQMDYRKILATHVKNAADMTISCIEVPTKNAANQLGVLSADGKGKITAFNEKPATPHALLDAPDYCLASMGNYVVNTDVLLDLLEQDANSPDSEHDFGKNIIPNIIKQSRVFAHRFRGPTGSQIPYWRDVGTLDSYWRAHLDLLNNSDILNLSDPNWPIRGHAFAGTTTKITRASHQAPCELENVLIGSGCHLTSCYVRQSVLSNNCKVETGTNLDKCVLLPDVTVGHMVTLENAIIDKGVTIPDNFVIDNKAVARQQGFTVTDKGVILITQEAIDSLSQSEYKIDRPRHTSKLTVVEQIPSDISIQNTQPRGKNLAINEG